MCTFSSEFTKCGDVTTMPHPRCNCDKIIHLKNIPGSCALCRCRDNKEWWKPMMPVKESEKKAVRPAEPEWNFGKYGSESSRWAPNPDADARNDLRKSKYSTHDGHKNARESQRNKGQDSRRKDRRDHQESSSTILGNDRAWGKPEKSSRNVFSSNWWRRREYDGEPSEPVQNSGGWFDCGEREVEADEEWQEWPADGENSKALGKDLSEHGYNFNETRNEWDTKGADGASDWFSKNTWGKQLTSEGNSRESKKELEDTSKRFAEEGEPGKNWGNWRERDEESSEDEEKDEHKLRWDVETPKGWDIENPKGWDVETPKVWDIGTPNAMW